MRLIDADELIKAIEQSRNNNPHKGCRIKRIHDTEHNHFIKMVSEQQTAFDKEKVIDELEKLAGIARLSGDYNKNCVINAALRIIKQGGLN